jgi:DNA-directed RNA polymerase subunit M/transcription elongation factor TFIIS
MSARNARLRILLRRIASGVLHLERKRSTYFSSSLSDSVRSLSSSSKSRPKVVSDVRDDPTLSRTNEIRCEMCGYTEAVYFHDPETSNKKHFTLMFVCCHEGCGHSWTTNHGVEISGV